VVLEERLRAATAENALVLFDRAATESDDGYAEVPGPSLYDLGITSRMLLPLDVHGKRVGRLALVRDATSARYSSTDVPLAREIALRAAIAIENALLYGRATRALEAREDLLAFVSHDLGNALSAIALCAGALQQDTSEGVRKNATRIGAASERASRLIRDLLTSAALEAGAFALVNLSGHAPAALVSAAIAGAEAAAAAKGVTLSANVPIGLPPVRVDRERILQVFANLLENAIKFTPRGGSIALHVSARGSAVAFSVHDTGPGIRQDELAQVFDRYWRGRANVPGTGLGLYIAKEIVERHGGCITAGNAPEGGGVFGVVLPSESDVTAA
jgi:signal transduction histidine kinase